MEQWSFNISVAKREHREEVKKMQINLRRIKAERVFKKISQAQMAKKLGISRTSYAKKEEALERLLLKVQIQDVNYVNRI